MFREYLEIDPLSEALIREDRWAEKARCNPPEERRHVPTGAPSAAPLVPYSPLYVKAYLLDGQWVAEVHGYKMLPHYATGGHPTRQAAILDAVQWLREQTDL